MADLKAVGLEVVSPEDARSYSAFNDIIAAGKLTGETVKGMNSVISGFYASTGMNYYFLPIMLPELAGGGSMTAMGNAPIVRKEPDLMSNQVPRLPVSAPWLSSPPSRPATARTSLCRLSGSSEA